MVCRFNINEDESPDTSCNIYIYIYVYIYIYNRNVYSKKKNVIVKIYRNKINKAKYSDTKRRQNINGIYL